MRRAVRAAALVAGGVVLGAAQADKIGFYAAAARARVRGAPPITDATSLFRAARALAHASGEFAVLSTVNSETGVASRLIQVRRRRRMKMMMMKESRMVSNNS